MKCNESLLYEVKQLSQAEKVIRGLKDLVVVFLKTDFWSQKRRRNISPRRHFLSRLFPQGVRELLKFEKTNYKRALFHYIPLAGGFKIALLLTRPGMGWEEGERPWSLSTHWAARPRGSHPPPHPWGASKKCIVHGSVFTLFLHLSGLQVEGLLGQRWPYTGEVWACSIFFDGTVLE